MVLSLAAVFGFFAAVFSYLVWVRHTLESKDDCEEALWRRYDSIGMTLHDSDRGIALKPGRFRIIEDDNLSYRLARTVKPFHPIKGEMNILITVKKGTVSKDTLSLMAQLEDIVHCKIEETGHITLVIYETNPDMVQQRLIQFYKNMCRTEDNIERIRNYNKVYNKDH